MLEYFAELKIDMSVREMSGNIIYYNARQRYRYRNFSSPVYDPRLDSQARDFQVSIEISLLALRTRRCFVSYSAADSPERIRSPCCRCLIADAASFAIDRLRYRSGALKSSVSGEPEPNVDFSVAARVAVFVEDSRSRLLCKIAIFYDDLCYII